MDGDRTPDGNGTGSPLFKAGGDFDPPADGGRLVAALEVNCCTGRKNYRDTPAPTGSEACGCHPEGPTRTRSPLNSIGDVMPGIALGISGGLTIPGRLDAGEGHWFRSFF